MPTSAESGTQTSSHRISQQGWPGVDRSLGEQMEVDAGESEVSSHVSVIVGRPRNDSPQAVAG